MLFLLAKIIFLLVLAAVLGAAFANWRWRSRFMEVTTEYHNLRDGWTAWRRTIETQLAAMAEPKALAEAVAAQLRSQGAVAGGAPAAATLGAEAAERLAADVATRVAAQVAELKSELGTQLTTQLATQLTSQVTPLADRIVALEQAVRGLEATTLAAPAAAVDLRPLLQRLDALRDGRTTQQDQGPEEGGESSRQEAPKSESSATAIAAIDLVRASASSPGTAPIIVGGASSAVQADAPAREALPAIASQLRNGSRNLLASAAFGRADDLRRIKGVAKALEKKLHEVGVYYFWQIAEWTAEDVAYVDAQLAAFKGRIERDAWVTQAQRFAAEPTAAGKPQE